MAGAGSCENLAVVRKLSSTSLLIVPPLHALCWLLLTGKWHMHKTLLHQVMQSIAFDAGQQGVLLQKRLQTGPNPLTGV